jgi:predicted transcriptional regulator
MNVNGWPVIEMLLHRRKKNQSDLSRLIGVSPAAITQAKQGDFQLNAPALEKMVRYLGATDAEAIDVYSQVVQARILDKLSTKFTCKIILIKK